MIVAFIGPLLFNVFLALLWSAVGYLLWMRLAVARGAHYSFTLGASFFVGTTTFLVAFGSLQLIVGAREALLITMMVGIIVVAFWFPWTNLRRYIRWSALVAAGFVLFLVLDLLQALTPLPHVILEPDRAPYAYGFGAVVHSFRAENIIIDIVSKNAFPFINQNFAQSAISSTPVLVGMDAPQVSLLIWHTLFIVFGTVFVWGAARSLLPATTAWIPTLLVAMGNAGISYRYISVTDTSHALWRSQNFETIIGLAGLTIAVLIFREIMKAGMTRWRVTFLCGLFFSWSMVGAHLVLIFLSIAGLWVLWNKLWPNWRPVIATVLVVAIGTSVGTLLLGGMFAFHAPANDIPGVKSVAQEGKKPIELRWFRTVEAEFHSAMKFSYMVDIFRGVGLAEDQVRSEGVVDSSEDANVTVAMSGPSTFQNIGSIIQGLKQNETIWGMVRIVRSLQLVALSLLGLILGFWYLYRRYPDVDPRFRDLYVVGTPLFLVGWVLSSVVFIYGQYGEVSRFFAPGVTLSLFILGYLLAIFFLRKERIKRSIVALIVILAVLPVFCDLMILGVAGNFFLPSIDHMRYATLGQGVPIAKEDVLSIRERLELLISPSVTRGRDPFVP